MTEESPSDQLPPPPPVAPLESPAGASEATLPPAPEISSEGEEDSETKTDSEGEAEEKAPVETPTAAPVDTPVEKTMSQEVLNTTEVAPPPAVIIPGEFENMFFLRRESDESFSVPWMEK